MKGLFDKVGSPNWRSRYLNWSRKDLQWLVDDYSKWKKKSDLIDILERKIKNGDLHKTKTPSDRRG